MDHLVLPVDLVNPVLLVIEDNQVCLELKENLVNVAFQVMLKQPMDPLAELVQKVTEVKM